MKKLAKINNIKLNPKNPRTIKDGKFKKLVKSIKTFPQMLEKRPIVVDENMIVLGGNMRLRACQEAELKEVWIDIAEGWTDKQKQEFIIRDNISDGEWDMEMLANEWDQDELLDWGFEEFELGIDDNVFNSDENIKNKNVSVKIVLDCPPKTWLLNKDKIIEDLEIFINNYGMFMKYE